LATKTTSQVEDTSSAFRDICHSSDAPLEVYDSWEYLLLSYSKRYLTYETDRLRAISGIIYSLEPILQDKCFAGLWENHLHHQLLWEAYSPSYRLPEVGPSWSWAGWRQEMYRAPGTSFRSTAEPVLSINSIYSAKYPSQLSIAPDIELKVQGFLFPYLLASKSLCIDDRELSLHGDGVKIRLPEGALGHDKEELFCMPVISRRDRYGYTAGLVVAHRGADIYERAGVFHMGADLTQTVRDAMDDPVGNVHFTLA